MKGIIAAFAAGVAAGIGGLWLAVFLDEWLGSVLAERDRARTGYGRYY